MMQSFLKEIGRGTREAKDLSFHEARRAVEGMVDDRATSAQIGAFLMAARMKGETVDELRAFVDVLRSASHPVMPARRVDLEIGGPFDGRDRTFASSVATALVLAAAGRAIALTGSEALPPKYGATTLDILRAMGMPLRRQTGLHSQERAVRHAEHSLESQGIAYLHLEDLCPPLAGLRPIRLQLGIRTLLHSVEKYLNVSRCDRIVSGVHHAHRLEAMGKLTRDLGFEQALIVQGAEGSAEFDSLHPTPYVQASAAGIRRAFLDPADFGFRNRGLAAFAASTAAEQAERTLAVLNGAAGPDRDQVVLNAAVLQQFLGGTPDLAEALELARWVLDSRHALRVWEAWKARTITLL